ncbi:MAG: hypothetical protein KA248_09995 [Kiritimatiellae bacterium]|nr:hypothetical protein [Kiritimatiellia bacterium]
MELTPRPDRPARPKRAGFVSRGARFLFRCLAVLFGTGVLLAAGLLLYLGAAGFPSWLVDRALRQLEEQGIHARVRRARLSVKDGVVLKGFRLYDSPEAANPVAEADRVALGLNVLEWLSLRHGVVGLRIRGARLQLHLQSSGPDRRTEGAALDNVRTTIQIRPGLVEVQGFSAEGWGMRIQAAGTIRRRMPEKETGRSGADLLRECPPWLLKVMEQARELRFSQPPRVRLDFAIELDDPARSRATLRLEARRTQTPVGVFDRCSLEAGLAGARAEVKSLVLKQADTRVSLSGFLSLANTQAEFRLFSDVSLHQWAAILPRAWRSRLSDMGYELKGRASLELWGGPAPLAEMKRHLGGWLSIEQAECGGVWVEKAFLSGSRSGDLVTIEKLDGVMGKGARRGSLKAAATYNAVSRAFHGELKGAFHPHLFKPLLADSQMQILNWFEFGDAPPDVELEFSGAADDLRQFAFRGKVAATSLVYRGVDLDAASAGLTLRGGVMRLDPLKVVRPEGGAGGWLELDFNRQTASFEIDSSAAPHAVARMIGPGPGRFLESYRFEGPAHITASGTVSYAGFSPVDVEAWVTGQRFGLGWALSDEIAFRVRALHRRLEITDIKAQAYGGVLTGRMAFYPLNDPLHLRYDAVGRIETVRFDRLIAALARVEEKPYEGLFSADFRLEGRVGTGCGRTALGEGTLRIEDGALFAIPLMGGLSEWLARIYPGLGFATQTDFHTTYVLKDGAFRTEEAMLEGTVLSLKGKGEYHLDQRIDMTVQVQPLREGIVAEALRLAASPLTKLLEFKLAGTLSEPKWRPLNLPKELFLIFD